MTIDARAGYVRLLITVSLTLALVAGARVPAVSGDARVLVVAPDGSDGNPGTLEAPFGTLTHAMQQLGPGDTLLVRGGEYRERVILTGSDLASGSPDARITVRGYEGEEPVVRGLLWMSNANYWTLDNLDVTWDDATGSSDEHMMRFYKGEGMVYQHSELWGARSHSALLIDGGARNFNLNHLFVHDTYRSNDLSQDHLIYVAAGSDGVIERCLLVNSENGRGVKIGFTGPGNDLPNTIIVRYNTIVDSGSGNVSTSYGTSDNLVERNIMVNAGDAYASVHAWHLTGENNVVRENIVAGSVGAVTSGSLLVNVGNLALDPMFADGYVPMNPALYDGGGVLQYGHLAGLGVVESGPSEPASVFQAINTRLVS